MTDCKSSCGKTGTAWIKTARVRCHHFIFPRLLYSSFTFRSWTLLLPPCHTCPTFTMCTIMEKKKQCKKKKTFPLVECLLRSKNFVLSFGFDLWLLGVSTLSGLDLKRKQRWGNCICLLLLCLFNSLYNQGHKDDNRVALACTYNFSQSQAGTALTATKNSVSLQPLSETRGLIASVKMSVAYVQYWEVFLVKNV